MWIFGVMTKKEMASLREDGYDVRKINEKRFNKLIESRCDSKDFESGLKKNEILACVWSDPKVHEKIKEINGDKKITLRERK